jgi:hypothetical protein
MESKQFPTLAREAWHKWNQDLLALASSGAPEEAVRKYIDSWIDSFIADELEQAKRDLIEDLKRVRSAKGS